MGGRVPGRPGSATGRVAAVMLPALWPAACLGLLLAVTASRYGLHGDELYFRMLPFGWWYDDQPPLTVWLSRSAAAISDAVWVQRVPAVVAAVAGVVLASATARVAGYGRRVQATAAWAHAAATYPMIVGHVFLTSSIDLVVWQSVVLLVMRAVRGRPQALAWAGVIAGLGCWNKLLVLVLVAGIAVALVVSWPGVLRSGWTWIGVLAMLLVGGVQVAAQVAHGLPMSQVSGDLIARDGSLKRLQVLPLVVAFTGPVFLPALVRGLCWQPRRATWPATTPVPVAGNGADGRAAAAKTRVPQGRRAQEPWGRVPGRVPVLLGAATVVTAWTLAFPAQPYYPVAVFLSATAAGWGAECARRSWLWRRRGPVIAATMVVSVLLALPVAPIASPVFRAVAAVDPVQRGQVGWQDHAEQVAAARRAAARHGAEEPGVVTDSYALAGALAYYGPGLGVPRRDVASGHNALWSLGPPPTDSVLLVGDRAVSLRSAFASCRPAGRLSLAQADPFGVAGSPMASCSTPRGGWAAVWERFRHEGA